MGFNNVNDYLIPDKGNLDTDNPNYANQHNKFAEDLLQHKNFNVDNKSLFIPQNGVLYYTSTDVTLADGDYKIEKETGTGDIITFVRRSSVWVEYERSSEDGTSITQNYNRKLISDHSSQAESDDANIIRSNTNDQNRIGAVAINQTVTNLAPGESSAVLPVIASVQNSSGTADSTSLVQGIPLVVSGSSSAEKIGINVRPGWDIAFKVNGNQAQQLISGYSYDSSVLTDRTTSFNTPGNDVQLFNSDNDTALIGLDTPFSVIELNLAISASKNINATYRYSTGNDTWSNLVIGSDTSDGFKLSSGQIRFNEPIDWDTSNLYNGNAVTAAYYVEITRTRNGLSTSPTESVISVFEDSPTTDFFIRGDGTMGLVQTADVDAENNSHYYSTDAGKAVYKDLGGTVNPLY